MDKSSQNSSKSGARKDPKPPPGPAVCGMAAIVCGVLEEEFEILARQLDWNGPRVLLEPVLHRHPDMLRSRIQEAIDQLEEDYHPESIILTYGLCSRGTEGIRARKAPLVIPRAHDCITLLLGDRGRYAEFMRRHPNTYWYSHGWIRNLDMPGEATLNKQRAEYIDKFGEEDANYLLEIERQALKGKQAIFIDMGLVPDREADIKYTEQAARFLQWDSRIVQGNPALLRDLILGNWDRERFAIAEAGETFCFENSDRVIGTQACSACPFHPEGSGTAGS